MKQALHSLIVTALTQLQAQGVIQHLDAGAIKIELPRDKSHGDFATNVAMALAKPNAMNPRALAEALIAALPATNWLISAEIAGPGFINFRLDAAAKFSVLAKILQTGVDFGRINMGEGKSVQVEFVSANPTGPLHVGHGRGAAYGSALVSVLRHAGYDVQAEYYVNDAGRQMDILATSVWLRYLALCGEPIVFPSNGYKGDYIITTARALLDEQGERLRHAASVVFAAVTPDQVLNDAGEVVSGDKEKHIDDIIVHARELLGVSDYRLVLDKVLHEILFDIKEDLAEFGVHFDNWFSERSLTESGIVDAALTRLDANGQLYEKDGAIWFKSTDYDDAKDRVVVRENGIKTYFASDIAYHYDKLARGFEKVINIWGSDHHGYIPRVRGAIQAMGEDDSRLDVLLVQFAVLYRGGEKASMSTRSGEFVTLRELREEIGNDATRFFYVMRKCDQHMDFDLDLAKSKSNENPLFYIQYAHARCCGVFAQADSRGLTAWTESLGLACIAQLTETSEADLAQKCAQFPEVIANAARDAEPHQIAYYLKELAHQLHSYYNNTPLLVEDDALRFARLTLLSAVRVVLANGLTVLGVSAPERM
jgi:arginyl-tRNA synthetase